MKTYKYTITFDVSETFKIRAKSPEEANIILNQRVEKRTRAVFRSVIG